MSPVSNNVSVNFTNVVCATDPLGVGFVCSEFGGNPVPLVGNTTWRGLLQALAPGHIRCSVAWYGGNPGYGAGGSSRTPGSAAALIQAVKNLGAIPLVSFNGDTQDDNFYPADGGSLVTYFNSNGGQNGGPITYWSIGNEPEYGGGGFQTAQYQAGSYAAGGPQGSASSTAWYMRQAANATGIPINIGAPAAGDWDPSLLSWAGGQSWTDTLSYHAYDGGNVNGTGFPTDPQLYQHMHTDLPGYKGGIRYGIEEMNWNPSYSGQAQFYNWENTCNLADNIGQALSGGGHATIYGDSNGALGLLNDGSGFQNQPGGFGTTFPAYWALGIWTGMNGQFFRYSANMVSATTTFAQGVLTAFASDNGKIVIVNKTASAQNLSIGLTLKNGVTSGTYSIWATNAGSATSPITQAVGTSSFSGGVISYTVPGSTAVSIDVTAGSSSGNVVTVNSPGNQSGVTGTAVSLQIQASDSATLNPSWSPNGTWTVQFDDEFTGTSLNAKYWGLGWQSQSGISGPVNGNEQAAYTSANVSVANSQLQLAFNNGSVDGGAHPYNGACVTTNTNGTGGSSGFSFTYGAIEARIFLPASGGQIANWPAFWCDGQSWPADGEMDIMEGLSGTAQYHFISPSGNPGGPASPQSLTGWHTFGANWEAGTCSYYYDGALVGTINSGITTAPMYIILDNTYGPTYGGPLATGVVMLVDWVRVWTAGGSGGGTVLTYAATGLPAGLSMASASGLISGTPTAAGAYSVQVTVTDATGAFGTVTFTWTITASGGNVITVANPGGQTGTVSTAITPLQISATDSASGQTLSYTATGLPAGLSIGSSTGQITGTPTTAASYSVTVTATDTTSATGAASFPWTIAAAGGGGSALTLVNNFSTGFGGNPVTTGNSGGSGQNAFDSVTVTNGNLTYSPTQAIHSSLAGAFSTNSSSGVSYVTWAASLGSQAVLYGRAYVYLTGYSPGADENIISFYNSGTFGGGIMCAASGQLRTQNAGFGETGGGPTLPTGQWFRLEWKLACGSAGLASLNVNYYASADSTTITASVTDTAGAFGVGGSVNAVNFGWPTTQASIPVMYMDALNVNITGYPGPQGNVVTLVNNCESGSGLVTVTPANSASAVANAFDGVITNTGSFGTAPWYATLPAHGNYAVNFETTTTVTTACTVYWAASLGTQTTLYGRVYIYLVALPAVDDTVIQFLSNGTFGGGIMIGSNGQLRVQSAAFAEVTTGPFLSPGAYFRLEWQLVTGNAGSASLTVNYYASMDSTTVTATVADNAGQYGSGGSVSQVSFGWNTPHPNQPAMVMDDFGLSVTGFLGPAGVIATGGVAPQPLALTGSALDANTQLVNNFESGSNGTAITTGNSGSSVAHAFDVCSVTNGSLTYSSTQAAHGLLSGAFSTNSSGGVSYVAWTTSVTPMTTCYGRAYLYLTAAPAVQDANILFRGTGASAAGSIQVTTGLQLALVTPSAVTALTFATVLPTGQWVRVEWTMVTGTAGNASMTVSLYTTPDSAIPAESRADTANAWGGTGGVAEVDFGWTSTHASQPLTYFDDVALSPSGLFGPAGHAGAGTESLVTFAQAGNAYDNVSSVTATGSLAMQPMAASGTGVDGSVPVFANIVGGNIVNDYGLDNVFYALRAPGLATSMLAFIGWDIAQTATSGSGKGPAVNVTDSAGNLWRQLGISHVTGTSRCAVWIADNPRQVSWVSVAVTGWAYSTSYFIAELDGMPSGFQAVGVDFVKAAWSDAPVIGLGVGPGTATTTDLLLGVLCTGGAGGPLTVPTNWSGIAAIGGSFSNQATTYGMYIPSVSPGAYAFDPIWSNAQPASGVMIGLKLTQPAPVQANPNFPRVVVEAAFGANPGNWTQGVEYTWDISGVTWTDISSRVIGDGTQGRIRVTRGRQYELSQEETGEISITLDNHDGIFTYGNTASPYYPNVVPGVPVRVSAWWEGTQYPVAAGYVERWPQEWPEMPQWGFSTVVAVDAYGPLSSTTLPSAVAGEVRKDLPYLYFPTNEQYSFTTQSLDPIKAPIDANGLVAVNYAFSNGRYGAYRDGTDQAVTTGQALNLMGDSDTSLGCATYVAPELNENGPGMFYFDPGIPTNAGGRGYTVEFWFSWGGGTGAATTLLNGFAGPSSFFAPGGASTAGGVLTVGVNTGPNTARPAGFFVNGANIATSENFSQTSLAPQHFVLASGPPTPLTPGSGNTYLNAVAGTVPNSAVPVLPGLRALALGPARFSYDVSDLCVYNGYNYAAGHLAVYPYLLTPQQVENHYVAGYYGAAYIPAPGRFAQVLTWGLLGLRRGGTAWYGSYGNSENTFMSEAYEYEGSSAADIMAQITQTEGGRAYVQANGSLVYTLRWSRYNQPVAAIFGDNGTTELPFLQESSFSVDNSFVYNQVTTTQNRGPNQTVFTQATDPQSQFEYFNRSGLSIQSYALTPFDVFDVTNWSLEKYRQPSQRVQQLSLDVAGAAESVPAMFATVLGLELNDNITVNRRPVGGAVLSVTGAIQQVQHDIGPAYWKTQYQVAPVYPENQALVADSYWSWVVSGTPVNDGYFIVFNQQASFISPGQEFTISTSPGTVFTVTTGANSGFGFTNIPFTPSASGPVASPAAVTQYGTNQPGQQSLSW